MIHELRIYHCMPGRVRDLSRRFETITLGMFARHGFRPLGFWTVAVGESNHDFHYMLGWENMGELERKWAVFMADPDWLKARAETEKDGPLIASITTRLLVPTAYSALK